MEDIRITIRIPANIHEQLKRVAEEEDRTLNAQIVRVLRQFAEDTVASDASPSPPEGANDKV